jgi:hypothetical protein
VTVTTTGDGEDADGYTVTVGSIDRSVAMSGSINVEGLAPGSYDVTLGGVAANCTVVGGATQSVTVTDGQGASVSFDVACLFDGAGVALTESICSALAPAAASGIPLDIVSIGGVPSSFGRPILARMSWDGDQQVSLGLVQESGGNANVMIPLHPNGSPDGGDVTVRISDEVQTCPPFTFTILPLPAAPGELVATVDVAQSLLDARAELFGTPVADLLNTHASGLEPALRLLAVAQGLVDDPSNQFSLRAFANGSVTDFGTAEADFADRLLGRTGLLDDLQSELAAIQAAGPALPALGAAQDVRPARALTPGLALDCITSIDMDAQLLDACMTLARDKVQGAASDSTQDRAIFAMDMAAMFGARIAGPISSLISFSQLYDAAVANNLPSSFVSLTVSPSPRDFLEDQDGPGDWKPALATAISNGWNLDDLLTDVIVGRITPNIAITSRLSWTQKQLFKRSNAAQYSDIRQVERIFQGLLDELVEALVGRGVSLTDGLLTVPPLNYGPVDVSDPEWTDSRIVTGTSIELPSHGQYDPVEPGASLIEVVTAVGKFGGTSIATDHEGISVGQLQLTLSPAEIFLAPGQDTLLTLTVLNSAHPDSVEIIPGLSLQGSAQISFGTGDTHTVIYTAPANPAPNSADVVGVRHTANGGARRPGAPERTASAVIRFGGIRIVTQPTCLSPGDSLRVEAVVPGVTNPQLIWTASAGTIDASGLFTAPSQPQVVEITVAYAPSPDVKTTLVLQVGGCTCQAAMRLGGVDGGATRSIRFTLTPDLSAISHIDWGGNVLGPSQSTMSLQWFGGGGTVPGGTIPVGSTGTYAPLAAGVFLGQAWNNPDALYDSIPERLNVTITENVGGNILAGQVSGRVSLVQTGTASIVPFSMSFYMEADPTYSNATSRVCRVE